MSEKDALRAKLFATPELERIKYTLNGVDIEMRMPLTGEVLDYSQGNVDDAGNVKRKDLSVINFLIDFAYVPGTNEKIFTQGDAPQLAALPYDAALQKIYLKMLTMLTGISVDNAVKNLSETSSNKTA